MYPVGMQRTDVDLRAIAGSGKDAAQKLEDALERLLRLAASGTDNSKHFESIVSFCDAGNSVPVRACAFTLVPSCAQYEGSAWSKLVVAVIAEVANSSPPSPAAHISLLQINAACSGVSAAERTAASAIRALASVPCVWLQAHWHDLCDTLRDAGSR